MAEGDFVAVDVYRKVVTKTYSGAADVDVELCIVGALVQIGSVTADEYRFGGGVESHYTWKVLVPNVPTNRELQIYDYLDKPEVLFFLVVDESSHLYGKVLNGDAVHVAGVPVENADFHVTLLCNSVTGPDRLVKIIRGRLEEKH